MSSDVADRLSRAALISLARFCAKRSPTRIAGTSMAAMTRINSRVRRLIGRSIRARIEHVVWCPQCAAARCDQSIAEGRKWGAVAPRGGEVRDVRSRAPDAAQHEVMRC